MLPHRAPSNAWPKTPAVSGTPDASVSETGTTSLPSAPMKIVAPAGVRVICSDEDAVLKIEFIVRRGQMPAMHKALDAPCLAIRTHARERAPL